MVTVSKHEVGAEIPFKGLSSDDKPTGYWFTEKIINGSSFFETDTQEVYFYNGENDSWLPQP